MEQLWVKTGFTQVPGFPFRTPRLRLPTAHQSEAGQTWATGSGVVQYEESDE
jgi:hypothetical protein